MKKERTQKEKDAGQYPGVAVDNSEKDKVTKKNVEDRTCSLNNNPRNSK